MADEHRAVMLPAVPGGAPEEALIADTLWGAIQALKQRGKAKKHVARELGLDIKTVRKWWRHAWRPQRRRRRARQLDRFEAFLQGRAPEVEFNAVVLHRELGELGYTGSYSSVVKHLQPRRTAWRPEEEPTVRFETQPGEQAQVDWGSTWIYLGDQRVRVHLFTMVLGYSRRIFARGYLSEGLGSLLDGHERAFEHFGGRTETILYDNPRTIVRSKDEGSGQVQWNSTFKDRMDFYGVEIRLCRYYRAQTKGKVESGVKYVKRNGLAGRRFRDLEELNAWLVLWSLHVADQRLHGTTHERPSDRFERSERAVLLPVEVRPPAVRERVETRIVPRDGMVAVEANRYPVPLEWAGCTAEVSIRQDSVWFRLDGADPIEHPRLAGKHQVARWQGPPRTWARPEAREPQGAPRFDVAYLGTLGEVAQRALGIYEQVSQEVTP
ncbi:MAG: IS21 family transposase [Acidobacteria bacterium]|nr:IS21 family transposase [Acidobacteriota bacterium]